MTPPTYPPEVERALRACVQAFERAAKKAGIEGYSYHDLRHFYVTHMFRAGTPAPVVQALAGHENLETTQRYAHAETADFRRANDNFEKLVVIQGGDNLETDTPDDGSDAS